MSKVAIVTDSTATIPAEFLQDLNIPVIPLQVIWDGTTFMDGINIHPDEFYTRLKTSKTIPTTSQPSPAAFEQMYRRLLDQGYSILSIHISSLLSGTCDSAIQAKAMLSDAPIELIDARTTSMSMGFRVLAAARAAAKGASLAECKAIAEQAADKTSVFFLVRTLEFLHRGGRIGGASAFVGTLLNMKPVLSVQNGRIEPVDKVRTFSKAQDRMLELFLKEAERLGPPYHIAAMHTDTPEEAQALLERACHELHSDQVVDAFVGRVSPVLGVHTGPGALGIALMASM